MHGQNHIKFILFPHINDDAGQNHIKFEYFYIYVVTGKKERVQHRGKLQQNSSGDDLTSSNNSNNNNDIPPEYCCCVPKEGRDKL